MLELLAQAPLVTQTARLCQTNLPCRFLQDEDIAVGELNELNEELGSTKTAQHCVESMERKEL